MQINDEYSQEVESKFILSVYKAKMKLQCLAYGCVGHTYK